MAAPKTRLDQMITKLREREFRITPQRLAILKILAVSDGHPSVETIYGKVKRDFPTTSLATVYKTLIVMKEIREVLELGFSDGSNRYDGGKPYPHPHLICTQCGEIRDLEAPALSELVQQASQDVGYQITSHRLDFYGLCPRCQANDRS